MNVKIKRVDKSLPLPVYEKAGSVGFDLLAREDMTIEPRHIGLIPGNIIVVIPDGYMLMIASRSSMPKKKGLTMPHGAGIIDQDYHGPADEIMIQVQNFTDQPVTVRRGEKIAQGLFVRVDVAEWEEVDEIKAVTRGGFGSSGGYHET